MKWVLLAGLIFSLFTAHLTAEDIPAPPTVDGSKRAGHNLSFLRLSSGEVILDITNGLPGEAPSLPSVQRPAVADSGSVTLTSSDISLPIFRSLSDPELRRELHLSPLQEVEVRKISTTYLQEYGQQLGSIRDEYFTKPIERSVVRNWEKLAHVMPILAFAYREQVEHVLTSQQLADYKTRVLPMRAYYELHDPDVRALLEMTPKQQKRFARISAEWERLAGHLMFEYQDHMVETLNAAQLEKARQLIQAPTLPDVQSEIVSVNDELDTLWDIPLPLPRCALVTRPSQRARLALSPGQEERLQAISAAFAKSQKEYREVATKKGNEIRMIVSDILQFPEIDNPGLGLLLADRLSCADQEHDKAIQKELQCEEKTRIEIDSLLTSDQHARLSEMRVRSELVNQLSNDKSTALLGLSDMQKAFLRAFTNKYQRNAAALKQTYTQQAFRLLTATQIEKVRNRLDQLSRW